MAWEALEQASILLVSPFHLGLNTAEDLSMSYGWAEFLLWYICDSVDSFVELDPCSDSEFVVVVVVVEPGSAEPELNTALALALAVGTAYSDIAWQPHRDMTYRGSGQEQI